MVGCGGAWTGRIVSAAEEETVELGAQKVIGSVTGGARGKLPAAFLAVEIQTAVVIAGWTLPVCAFDLRRCLAVSESIQPQAFYWETFYILGFSFIWASWTRTVHFQCIFIIAFAVKEAHAVTCTL